MARPCQQGCAYFPLDVHFLEDRKIRKLRAEFGLQAESVLIRLWCQIYEDKGYYLRMCGDDLLVLADGIPLPSGTMPGYVGELIAGCCRHGLFDERVFRAFGVLTSAGVQARYLQIKAKQREIPVIKEYWVLGKDEIEPGAYSRISFFSISGEKTPVSEEEMPVISEKTPQKEKESKEKKKEKPQRTGTLPACFAEYQGSEAVRGALEAYAQYRRKGRRPFTEDAARLALRKLERLADEAGVRDRDGYKIEVLNQSILNGWSGLFAAKDFQDRCPPAPAAPEPEGPGRVITPDMDLASLF